MKKHPTPTLSGVKLRDDALELRWNGDTLVAKILIVELRYQCPCAHCVSEITGDKLIQRDSIAEDIKLIDMQPVGNYAYRILYSDGHDSGIYPIQYLHSLSS
ncbi:MAG: DUF971 domain-containing protein [Planctomycetota bacterium]|jgi:DUF971 family protein|nr:DUF971 domain-containing protein [Planctomycetota bacterium]